MKTRIDFVLYKPDMRVEPVNGSNVIYSTNNLFTIPNVGDYVRPTFNDGLVYKIEKRVFNNDESVTCYISKVSTL